VTDQSDYSPGSTADITATGFDPGSTIEFSVQVIDPGPDGVIGTADDTLEPAVTWLATDGAPVTDGDGTVNGTVTTTLFVNSCYANTTILLTATEVQVAFDGTITTVGPVATETFMDSATQVFVSSMALSNGSRSYRSSQSRVPLGRFWRTRHMRPAESDGQLWHEQCPVRAFQPLCLVRGHFR
jgi:hypothetical protein